METAERRRSVLHHLSRRIGKLPGALVSSERRVEHFCGGRDNNFNLLRFLAASAVIFSHSYAIAIQKDPFFSILGANIGHVAVDAFFVISGFLIARSFDRRRSLSQYMKARFLRIFPALWVMLLLTVFIVGPLFTTLSFQQYFSRSETWSYLVFNGLLIDVRHSLPGVFESSNYAGRVNASLWTLPIEFRMYLMVPLLGLLGFLGSWRRFLIALLLLLTAWILVPDLLVFLWGEGSVERLALFFSAGTLVYLLRSRIPLHGLLLLMFAIMAWFSRGTSYHPWVLGAATTYAVFWFGYVPGGWLRHFNRIGDYSYGLYIFAFPIQQMFSTHNPSWDGLTLFGASFPAILTIAMASWHWIEAPALRRKEIPLLPQSMVRGLMRVKETVSPQVATLLHVEGMRSSLVVLALVGLAWLTWTSSIGLDYRFEAAAAAILPGGVVAGRLLTGVLVILSILVIHRHLYSGLGRGAAWVVTPLFMFPALYLWRIPSPLVVSTLLALIGWLILVMRKGGHRYPVAGIFVLMAASFHGAPALALGAVVLWSASRERAFRKGGPLDFWLAWLAGSAWLWVMLWRGELSGLDGFTIDALLSPPARISGFPGEQWLGWHAAEWLTLLLNDGGAFVRSWLRTAWLWPVSAVLALFLVRLHRPGVVFSSTFLSILVLSGVLSLHAVLRRDAVLWWTALPFWVTGIALLLVELSRQMVSRPLVRFGLGVLSVGVAGTVIVVLLSVLGPAPPEREIVSLSLPEADVRMPRVEREALNRILDGIEALGSEGVAVEPELALISRLAAVPVWREEGNDAPPRWLLVAERMVLSAEKRDRYTTPPNDLPPGYEIPAQEDPHWPAGFVLLHRERVFDPGGEEETHGWSAPLMEGEGIPSFVEIDRGGRIREAPADGFFGRSRWLGRDAWLHGVADGVRKGGIVLPLCVPRDGELRFSFGTHPATWSPRLGDGTLFELFVVSPSGEADRLFRRYIDPKNHPVERRWHAAEVSLGRYGGQNVLLVFTLSAGPRLNRRNGVVEPGFDYGGWGDLRLHGTAAPSCIGRGALEPPPRAWRTIAALPPARFYVEQEGEWDPDDPDLLLGLAHHARWSREAEAAIRYASAFLARYPRNGEAGRILAWAHRAKGDLDRAAAVLEELLALKKTRWGLWKELAYILVQKKDFSRALEIMDWAPISKRLGWNGRLWRSKALFGLERYAEAEREAARLLEQRPGENRVRMVLADALAALGDQEGAVHHYRVIAGSGGGLEVAALMRIVRLHLRHGRRDEARRVLAEVLRKRPDHPAGLALARKFEDWGAPRLP